MKDLLIRSTPSPLEEFDIAEVWRLNAFHNNVGNVAFPYGLIRNLTSEYRSVVSDWYGARLPDSDVVNERYDAYILPMANDLGAHFAGQLRRLTKFIKELTIPVIVVGIGGAFSISDSFHEPKPYDGTVKAFMDAVLEHSALVGLRGEITARYLSSLGYKEDRHYQVIGDPTLYDAGPELNLKDPKFDSSAKIAFNMTPKAPRPALEFLNRIPAQFENSVYVPQDIGELSKVYSASMDVSANPLRDTLDCFPNSMDDEVYRSGRVRMFLTAPAWFKYMEGVDFSVGTRIHGNILPTRAGVPSLTLAYGSRLKELVDYHALPYVMAASVSSDARLGDLIGGVDFGSPARVHGANFERFVGFMDANGLAHSYRSAGSGRELEFDRQLSLMDPVPPLSPLSVVDDPREMFRRVAVGYEINQEKVIVQKERIAKLEREVRDLRLEVRKLEKSRANVVRGLEELAAKFGDSSQSTA